MNPIPTKMSECLDFMILHGANLKAVKCMEEAILWQQMEEDIISAVTEDGPED